MYFRSNLTVSRLSLDRWEGPFRIELKEPFPIIVELRAPDTSEREKGFSPDNAMGFAQCAIEPPKEIRGVFDDLSARRVPAGSLPPADWEELLDDAGRIKEKHVAPLGLLPKPFQNFVRDLQRTLWNSTRRTVRVLRWRYGLGGPHSPFASRMSDWSYDGTTWSHLPYEGSVYMSVEVLSLNPKTVSQDEIARLVDGGNDEPIGHELFREAWDQRTSNPRSSLVVGMAAIEAGLKHYISGTAPATRWLVENVPSPPLTGMLKNYLPSLPAKLDFNGTVFPPPKALIKAIQKGVELRNKTVHVGEAAPPIDDLDEILQAVKDVLWLLDYYAGNKWALAKISSEIRDEFVSQSPPTVL